MEKKMLLRRAMSHIIPIDDDEWAAFEPHIAVRNVRKKDNLIVEGQTCAEIGFVLRGAFRQYHVVDGEERTTFFFFENDYVCNYESFISGQPSDTTIEALEDGEILFFSRETMTRLFRLYPKYEVFGRLIAEQVYICAMNRLKTFLLNSPEQRYLSFLKSSEASIILERVPQHFVASYLGITPVSLSRIRARVARQKPKYTPQ